MVNKDKVILKDNETGETFEGYFSSENNISISLKRVKGYGNNILVFNKDNFIIMK